MASYVIMTVTCILAFLGLCSCCTYSPPMLLCLDWDDNTDTDIQSSVDFYAPDEIYAIGATIGTLNINFGQRENVKEITLADCGITSFAHSDIFSSLTGLKVLNLTINGLTTIPALPKSLKSLDISGNDIAITIADSSNPSFVQSFFSPLEGLEQLEELDLSHNDLEYFGGVFISNRLKYLDLSYNDIYAVHLQNTPWTLNVSHTLLNGQAGSFSIENYNIHPRGQRKTFDVNNANIQRLDLDFFASMLIWGTKSNLNVDMKYGNPWICDCHTVQFQKMIKSLQRSNINPKWFDDIVCQSPSKNSGDKLVEVLEADLKSVGSNCP